MTILEEATQAVNGPRRNDYGTPLENHTVTAELWGTYLGIKLTAEQVCMMNILQKVSRSRKRITRDTLVDIGGYAFNVELIEVERGEHKD